MNARDQILVKQTAWARLQGIDLIGSRNEQGAKVYTGTLEENLFVVKLSESTVRSFSQGDGNELGNGEYPGKMQALHSSSALGVGTQLSERLLNQFLQMTIATNTSTRLS